MTMEEYGRLRANEAQARTEAKARAVAAFVAAATVYPVSKPALAAGVGGGVTLDRGIKLAVERGDIISHRGGPRSGYFPPEN